MENIENYQYLANAIVEQAAKDYIKARKFLAKHPKNEDALRQVEECKRFFHSSWYEYLTKVDPDFLLEKLDKVVMA